MADLRFASVKAESQGTGTQKVWKVEDRPGRGYPIPSKGGKGRIEVPVLEELDRDVTPGMKCFCLHTSEGLLSPPTFLGLKKLPTEQGPSST